MVALFSKTTLFAAFAGFGVMFALQTPAAAQPECNPLYRANPRLAESFGIQMPQPPVHCNQAAPAAPHKPERARVRERRVEEPQRQRRAEEPRRQRRADRRRSQRRVERDHRRDIGPDIGYRRDMARSCTPHRAVWKASRMGLENAHIVRVRRHRIVVAGWDFGYRARIVFAREPRCPVIAYR